jgi:hypothetical protein
MPVHGPKGDPHGKKQATKQAKKRMAGPAKKPKKPRRRYRASLANHESGITAVSNKVSD